MGVLTKVCWVFVVSWAIAACAMALAVAFSDSGSAADKRAAIWTKITADTSRGSWPSTLALGWLFIESMSPTISYVSDEFPSGRSKLIHSVGATAQFHFNWDSNPYTGLFQQADYGIVRISGAKQWDTSKDAKSGGFTPGMGIKIFRDNVPSANFVAMRALQPQDSWNPFKYVWSNHVSPKNLDFALTLIAKKFQSVSQWANQVGLSDLASIDQNGNTVTSPKFPWQLLFVPNPQLQSGFPDTFTADLPNILVQIPSGFTLWEVQAVAEPNGQAVRIGDFVLDSQFTTSKYADETMFIKHQAFEEDLKIRSDWLNVCSGPTVCPVCPLDC